jgi:hypothetical protein
MKRIYFFILFAIINFLAYAESNRYEDLLLVNGTTTAAGQMSPLVTLLLAIGLIALGLGVSYFLMRDEINLPDNDSLQSSQLTSDVGTTFTSGSLRDGNLGETSGNNEQTLDKK